VSLWPHTGNGPACPPVIPTVSGRVPPTPVDTPPRLPGEATGTAAPIPGTNHWAVHITPPDGPPAVEWVFRTRDEARAALTAALTDVEACVAPSIEACPDGIGWDATVAWLIHVSGHMPVLVDSLGVAHAALAAALCDLAALADQ